jgi:thiol-disulfide isomerase/thioredoxin
MRTLCLTFFFISFIYSVKSQSEKEYYKDAVDDCIKNLNQQSRDAFLVKKDNDLGRTLFDSLVNNCVKGKYLSNYSFKTYNKKTIQTDQVSKPILLLTSATWCAPCWAEIPTLNKLAEEYSNDIQFIVLFADQKRNLKKMAAKYDSNIWLIPSINRPTDKWSVRISGFNHLLDYPTGYLINTDKKILDLTSGAAYPNDNMTWDQANEINEKKLRSFIEPVLD